MAAVAHASPADLRRLSLVRPMVVRPVGAAGVPTAVYRRRRAVAAALVVVVVSALVLLAGGLLASLAGAPVAGGPLNGVDASGAPAAVYVVQPGDTFWAIAERLQPGQDPRPLVARLVAAHGSPALVAGERLALPGRA